MVAVLCSGCALFRNPSGSWNKATGKVEAAQDHIAQNQDAIIKQGKNYVYATKLALDADPATNRYHAVESTLTDKAMLTLGPPSMQDAQDIQGMVGNLLSNNAKQVAKGEKQLMELDERVIDLQSENTDLRAQLAKAEQKVLEVGTVNAGYASKWTSLIKIFWWIVYAFIAFFVIRVLSVVLPPPYNSIVGLISVPIGLVIKGIQGIVPEAKQAAGVVAAGTYDATKLALSHIIEAIEDAKVKKPEAIQALEPFLKDTTSKEVTRPLITEVKKELGYV